MPAFINAYATVFGPEPWPGYYPYINRNLNKNRMIPA